jgi:hypothetical protein
MLLVLMGDLGGVSDLSLVWAIDNVFYGHKTVCIFEKI